MDRQERAFRGAVARGAFRCAAIASAVLLAWPAAAVAENMSVFDPASPPAHTISELFVLVSAVAAGILTIVIGVLVYCIVRFRATAESRKSEPPQIYGSSPIEVAWTVGPLLIVFVLFLVVVRSVVEIKRETSPEGSVHVRVIAHQWWWEFEYLDQDRQTLFRTANEMVVPASLDGVQRPVHLLLESADVVHSFWVPRLAGKTDVIPGHTNTMWFQPEEVGSYHGQCTEFCGTQHANMLLLVEARPAHEYEDWIAAQQKPAVDDASVSAGRELFLSRTCVNCHTIRGTIAQGTVGPDLTHLKSRRTLAAMTFTNTRDNLTAWLHDPQTIKPGCNMPDLKLSEDDLTKLVDYLETLR